MMLPDASGVNPDRTCTGALSLSGRRSWLVLAAMCVLLASAPALPQSGPATPPTQARGEVLMLTSELIVVKSADGASILIPLGKDTPVDPSLKVGDQVEVVAKPDRQVASIRKLAP